MVSMANFWPCSVCRWLLMAGFICLLLVHSLILHIPMRPAYILVSILILTQILIFIQTPQTHSVGKPWSRRVTQTRINMKGSCVLRWRVTHGWNQMSALKLIRGSLSCIYTQTHNQFLIHVCLIFRILVIPYHAWVMKKSRKLHRRRLVEIRESCLYILVHNHLEVMSVVCHLLLLI